MLLYSLDARVALATRALAIVLVTWTVINSDPGPGPRAVVW